MKKIYRKPETEIIRASSESLLDFIPISGGSGTSLAPSAGAIEDDSESLLEE